MSSSLALADPAGPADSALGPNPLVAYVEQLKARIRRAETEIDWTPPEPPESPPSPSANWLQWDRPGPQARRAAIAIEELREEMPRVMRRYVLEEPASGRPLLVKVAAGGGKTTAGIEVAQWAAVELGLRVLWAAPRHSLFDDLFRIRGFDPRLWYHWLPIHESQGYHDPIPTTCRYAPQQQVWMQRGYEAMDLCLQLCMLNGHLKECRYRGQARVRDPVIFAQHQHLASGLAIDDFDLAIVDELPLGAFVEKRVIPPSGLLLENASGAIEMLTLILSDFAEECRQGRAIHGRELFDGIGDVLGEVYDEIDVYELMDVVPKALQVPRVRSYRDVEDQPYRYLLDFLRLALNEYHAWRNGWPRWAERIKITARGLHLLDRAEPWEALPRRVIVLDATAEPALYRRMLKRELAEPYHPAIKRKGRVYQITRRLNGKGSLVRKKAGTDGDDDDEEVVPTRFARELIEQVLALVEAKGYRERGRVAIICHLDLEPMFVEVFGPENVQHFGNLRGTNEFEDVVCLIVAGTPAPRQQDVIEIATALNPERIEPFAHEDGSLFYAKLCELAVTDDVREHSSAFGAPADGLAPWRLVKGYWSDEDLAAIHMQIREAELLQALHRARPNGREGVDVWLFSSVPTGELLDGVWNDLPIGAEPAISWRLWLYTLQPWLEQQWEAGGPVGVKEIAAFLDRPERGIRRGRWIRAIHDAMPGMWVYEDDPAFVEAGKPGPKMQRLRPVET